MSTASPIDLEINPNNRAQRYTLWGNGRIDAIGGAVPIVGQATWYNRLDQPIAMAMWITNWATGAGYVLDMAGGVHEFNGAPALSGGVLQGVPYVSGTHRYVDWAWNTNGGGQGVVLDCYGQLYVFGGAAAPARTGPRWTWPAAKKLKASFSGNNVDRAITLDIYGGLHGDFNQTNVITPGLYSAGNDVARDFIVTTWAATPGGYELDKYGGVHEFGPAAAIGGFPYRPGADVARVLYLVTTVDPLQVGEIWSGGQTWEWTNSTPPTVVAGGGQTEVQRVAITGTPTAGTFTLTFNGQTTAAIAFNATASAVQTALRALSGIGSTGVTVTGGPGPGTAWVVTFAGSLALTNVAQMTATSSLTGGTAPTITITTTTPGEDASPAATVTTTTRPLLSWRYSDPQSNSQAAWEVYVYTQTFASANDMSDPSVWAASAVTSASGVDQAARGVLSPVHLANGTYREYVRAKDSAGQWSAWSNWGWTQNVPLPATPTGLSATPNQGAFTVALSVTATTGGSATLVRFESSDDGGTTWIPVYGADAVPLTATTTATDRTAPLGITRTYRALAYALDPAVQSTASATATAKLTTMVHLLQTLTTPTKGGQLKVQEPLNWSREIEAGVFRGLGAKYPTVLKDGTGAKAASTSLNVLSMDAATWAMIEAMAESGSTLVYRGPFGDVVYCELVGTWTQQQVRAAPTATETTPLRHMHSTVLPLVEVKPPQLVS